MFMRYLKSRLWVVMLPLMFALVFALVLSLCKLPTDAVLYALLICLSLCMLYFIVDYLRFLSRLRLLMHLEKNPEGAADALPMAQDEKEAAYQRILRKLRENQLEQDCHRRELLAERSAYYTVWTHQIKTPIAAMRLILQGMDGGDVTGLRGELKRIEQYAQMALCYIRLDSPSTDYVFRRCKLDEIVRAELRAASPLFIRSRIALNYAPLNCEVVTDEKWLSFVIGQILSNALKYTQPGGSISIAMTDEHTLTISDTGVGIPQEDLPRVTENGFTGINGRSDKCATGLGLYLSRRILTKLGYELKLTSKRGEGTNVSIIMT